MLPKCDILIVDEMHISHNSQTMLNIKNELRPMHVIGLSATPIDEKGAKLQDVEIIETISVKELTKQGYLSKVETNILTYAQLLDFEDIGAGAEYTDEEIDGKLNNPEYNKAVFDGWLKLRTDVYMKTLGFVSTISHAETLADYFNSQGYSAYAYHSKLSIKERERIMEDFRNNKVEIMFSVSALIAGFDMPDIECGIMMRPTKRVRTYLQAIGRIMRKDTNPTSYKSQSGAIWLDAAQITSEHGLYDKPYDFKISDAKKLKKYKNSRKEPYITYMAKQTESDCVFRVTESSLEDTKTKIEGSSSLEALIARYDAENEDIRNLISIGFKIARKIGLPATAKVEDFVCQTVVPYIEDEFGNFKAIKTRMRNIIKDGKKLASLHYFPKFLKENMYA
jgi:superfamily II DNA or RNA helicase